VAVAALSDGGYIVTWMSADLPGTDRFDIYAQRYDGSGSALGSETLVNVTTLGSQRNPDLPRQSA